jgi:hypothetical protein
MRTRGIERSMQRTGGLRRLLLLFRPRCRPLFLSLFRLRHLFRLPFPLLLLYRGFVFCGSRLPASAPWRRGRARRRGARRREARASAVATRLAPPAPAPALAPSAPPQTGPHCASVVPKWPRRICCPCLRMGVFVVRSGLTVWGSGSRVLGFQAGGVGFRVQGSGM